MTQRDTNPNFMNGVPELLILRLLQQEEMYGYEIVQAIRDRTGERRGAEIAPQDCQRSQAYLLFRNARRDASIG